jgi:hypothetical protein
MKKLFFFFAQIFQFFLAIANDLLVLSGIAVIIWTNFRINLFFGWYSLGGALILAGLGLTRLTYKRPQK